MAAEKIKPGLIFFFIIVILGLVCCGIYLIFQSNEVYKQSYDQSKLITEKLVDPAFTKTLTALSPNYSAIKDGYSEALLYFTLAIGTLLVALLLPRLQTFALSPTGGLSVTLRDVQEKVESLVTQTNNLQSNSAGEGGKIKPGKLELMKTKRGFPAIENALANDNDDPQKGKWGGLAENKNRKISAEVKESNIEGFYELIITVENIKPNPPLTGSVKFHLHNTFLNPNPVITVQNGKAILNLTRVYGAFTVGAEADDGATQLELDLSKNDNFPKGFREG